MSPIADPANYHDYITYQFTGGDGSILDKQKEVAAIQLGLAACADRSPEAIADCIQNAYDTLQTANPANASSPLIGGNYNFSTTAVLIQGHEVSAASLGCTFGRCGVFDSLHFHGGNDPTFHVDTANPWFVPVGSFVHLFWDVVGGHSWWSGGIPR